MKVYKFELYKVSIYIYIVLHHDYRHTFEEVKLKANLPILIRLESCPVTSQALTHQPIDPGPIQSEHLSFDTLVTWISPLVFFCCIKVLLEFSMYLIPTTDVCL